MSGVIICGGRSYGRRITLLLACYGMESFILDHAERIRAAQEELRKASERARKQMEIYIDEVNYLAVGKVDDYRRIYEPHPIPDAPQRIGKPSRGYVFRGQAVVRRYI